MNLQKQIKMKIKWTLWQDNLQLYHQLNENITLLFLGIKDGRKHQSFGYASFCLQFYKVKQVAGKGLKILRSTEWHKKFTKTLRVVLRMVQKKYGHFLWTVFNCLGVAGPLITQEILIPIRPTGIGKMKKNFVDPFYGLGSTVSRLQFWISTTRRQFTLTDTHWVPRNPRYFFDPPRKGKRLGRPWINPMTWESRAPPTNSLLKVV